MIFTFHIQYLLFNDWKSKATFGMYKFVFQIKYEWLCRLALIKHNVCKKLNISTAIIIYRLYEIDLKFKKYYYVNVHPPSATNLPKMNI